LMVVTNTDDGPEITAVEPVNFVPMVAGIER